MKKPPHKKAGVLRSLEEARFDHRLAEREKKAKRNRRKNSAYAPAKALVAQKKSKKWNAKDPWSDLAVPQDLDLEQNRDVTCDFIEQIRKHVRAGIRIRLNFDDCKTIRLSALVLLLAQIHKLRLEHGQEQLTGTYPSNPRLERLLAESGFYQLLGVRTRKNTIAKSRLTRFIRFKSDKKPNSAEIPKLRTELLGEDLHMPTAIAKLIFRALSEAMTNVNHHAYRTKSVRVSELGGRWWMVANVSSRSRLFTLAFYDAGVGIPKTLPRKYPIELILGALSMLPGFSPDDGQMIRAAMELGRSRTGATNRGKGLMDLVKLIDTVGAGEMTIHSRQGSYAYSAGKDAHSNHEGFVEGTLIEWRLPIDKALERLPQELADEISAEY